MSWLSNGLQRAHKEQNVNRPELSKAIGAVLKILRLDEILMELVPGKYWTNLKDGLANTYLLLDQKDQKENYHSSI